jgi:spore cortex formation protein SpoVR/YcgB (stage V sporulation)
LLGELAGAGVPRIELVEADRSRALRLVHRHDGRDLQLARAGDTLARIEALWRAPVVLDTLEKGVPRRLSCRSGAVESLDLPAVASDELAG